MHVAEGLEWLQVYWVRGYLPKFSKYRNGVQDPPCAGTQHAFILRGKTLSTIFCPYSLTAYSVVTDCSEIALATEPKPGDWRPEYMKGLMEAKWASYQSKGWQKDYDTAALIMRKFGWSVPQQMLVGGQEDTRKKGGKPVGSALLKPVKKTSKRGIFLEWFMISDNCARSVREAMAKFSMSRSNVLSYLHMINKDHGLGYELMGDTASVLLPPGVTDPFNTEQPSTETLASKDEDDWLT